MTADRTPGYHVDRRLPPGHLTAALRADARAGLTGEHKHLPPTWFYDARGSKLFEQITRLPEYYPTRAEESILRQRRAQIAELTCAHTLIEFGSGSSEKTRLLLDALTSGPRPPLRHYLPMDVSESAVVAAGEALAHEYPHLRVRAVVSDFDGGTALLREQADSADREEDTDIGPRLVAFLGGTLGNLTPQRRAAFLRGIRTGLRGGDALLLGADLVKDPDVLRRAYDDAQGVTADFNKNLLQVLNRELGADFDPDSFTHTVRYNEPEERIEMRLAARCEQRVALPSLGLTVEFAAGEELLTETSAKFRRAGLNAELTAAGFSVRHCWSDPEERFALLLATPEKRGGRG